VIATPSALHSAACIEAFERGLAVFCQKPLSRTLSETESVLSAARRADRLLRVDFSYRHCRALERTRDLVRSGELGTVHHVDLVFHNAYGPSASWANDPRLAGGGCLMDLGIHLLDALGFVLGSADVVHADARLYRDGKRVSDPSREIDDFAAASLELSNGASVQLACSWRSSFGSDARISAEFFGSRGGVRFSNVDGSFYDFACDLHRGAARERLVQPPDDWGGRAFVAFLRELRQRREYAESPEVAQVARVLDLLYGRSATRAASGREPERTPANDLSSGALAP
jgi:predicted dehydrogenase